MNKNIIIVIIGIMLVGGGVVFFMNGNTPNGEARSQARVEERRTQLNRNSPLSFASTTPGTIDDLQLGVQVFAIGAANQDGSITAESIFVGDIEIAPEQFRRESGSQFNEELGGQNGNSPREFRERQLPDGFNSEEFQNLTQEERQARFQELQTSGEFQERGFSGGGLRGAQNGMTMVRGEIIGMDGTILTIKIPDGGSKLIFYSDITQIFKPVQ